jgi:hypothetical protein
MTKLPEDECLQLLKNCTFMKTLLADKAADSSEFPTALNQKATSVIESKKAKTFTIGAGSIATEVTPIKNNILLINTQDMLRLTQ